MGPTSAHELMTPPHLGSSAFDGDTRAETPSREQAEAGPNPADIDHLLGQQGDPRRPVKPSALDDLLLLPMRFGDLAREIRNLRNLLAMAFAPVAWVNQVATVDVAGTALGSGSYLRVMHAQGGTGRELRNVMVGGSAAGLYQLLASSSDAIYANRLGRVLGSVRLTANMLTVPYTPLIHVEPNEHLYLYNASAAVNFDFSAEYRARRSQ
jgi:hypothetical protein